MTVSPKLRYLLNLVILSLLLAAGPAMVASAVQQFAAVICRQEGVSFLQIIQGFSHAWLYLSGVALAFGCLMRIPFLAHAVHWFEQRFFEVRSRNLDNSLSLVSALAIPPIGLIVALLEWRWIREWAMSAQIARFLGRDVAVTDSVVFLIVMEVGLLLLVPLVTWALARIRPSRFVSGHDYSASDTRLIRVISVFALVFWVLPILGGMVERWQASRVASQNVLIVLVDCMRADHVGAYGYTRETTPNIDAVAADGVVFEYPVAQSNWTKPSVASLLTSLYPSQHRILEGDLYWEPGENVPVAVPTVGVLPEGVHTLAEAMRAAGFATAGFVNQAHLVGYLGFDQGFEIYGDRLSDDEVLSSFKAWLPRRKAWFAYLHFNRLHSPYEPLERFDIFGSDHGRQALQGLIDGPDAIDFPTLVRMVREGDMSLSSAQLEELMALYDGELLEVDHKIGEIIRHLKRNHQYTRTMIYIIADHGDGFLEHGFLDHGGTSLYSELTRVPLIVKFPHRQYAGSRVDGIVQLVDIMPTILEWHGLQAPPDVVGNSFRPLIKGEGLRRSIAFSESEGATAIFHHDYKYLLNDSGGVEAYRYPSDTMDRQDLSQGIHPETLAEVRQIAEKRTELNAAYAESFELQGRELEAIEIEQLRALGYLD
jgi:arylsulfatase A-like enzyme